MNSQVGSNGIKFAHATWGGMLGQQPNQIYLPPYLIQRLAINPRIEIQIQIGTLKQATNVSILNNTVGYENLFFISPDIHERCEIPINQKLTVKYEKATKTLYIGPLIGLFATRNVKDGPIFSSQEPLLTALCKCSDELAGLVYIFCPEDIDWLQKSVLAMVPLFIPESTLPEAEISPDIEWHHVNLPLPDVVYDRIPTRTVEKRPEVTEAKSQLINSIKLKYFNPMFLDKWETHTALSQCPEVNDLIPPTEIVTSEKVISRFLNQYQSIFLKPAAGSLGRKIWKIVHFPGKGYQVLYRDRNHQTVEKFVTDFTSLYHLLEPMLKDRQYIVQKDLHLANYHTGPFDIRVLMQKDMYGRWRRTKIYTRVAESDSFLSNLSEGGYPVPIALVLKDVFGQDFASNDILAETLRDVSKKIPPALEQVTGRLWGELGLDLGIDVNGKVWIIEINSKPFRALVSSSGATKVIHRSLMRPLEYAKFLAGFYRHSCQKFPP